MSATANLLTNNVSNTGGQGSVDFEDGQAEFRLTNFSKNNGGGNKANNTAIPKTTAPTMCSEFPGTYVTSNFAAASLCE